MGLLMSFRIHHIMFCASRKKKKVPYTVQIVVKRQRLWVIHMIPGNSGWHYWKSSQVCAADWGPTSSGADGPVIFSYYMWSQINLYETLFRMYRHVYASVYVFFHIVYFSLCICRSVCSLWYLMINTRSRWNGLENNWMDSYTCGVWMHLLNFNKCGLNLSGY
jgi:hypothetical protein